MKYIKLILFLAVTISFFSTPLFAQQPVQNNAAIQQANAELNDLAAQLAMMIKKPGFRGFLRSEIVKSKNSEGIVELDKFLNRAAHRPDVPPGLTKATNSAQKIAQKSKMSGINELAGFDLYLPVGLHREKWKGGEDILIAVSPFGRETEIREIVAFEVRTGKQVILDPNNPPAIPVIVIAPEEHESHAVVPAPRGGDKIEPKSVSRQDAIRNEKRASGNEAEMYNGNSTFSLRYIKIYKDHEPWYKGDPEIEIKFCQDNVVSGPDFHQIDASWVDEENRTYWLGKNYYFDTNFKNQTIVDVWERDTCCVSARYRTSCMGANWSRPDTWDHVGYKVFYKTWWPYDTQYGMYTPNDTYFWIKKYH
jgi:hypothetical protein